MLIFIGYSNLEGQLERCDFASELYEMNPMGL